MVCGSLESNVTGEWAGEKGTAPVGLTLTGGSLSSPLPISFGPGGLWQRVCRLEQALDSSGV